MNRVGITTIFTPQPLGVLEISSETFCDGQVCHLTGIHLGRDFTEGKNKQELALGRASPGRKPSIWWC